VAQPDTVWTRTFGGDTADGGYSVCQTSDGGYAIAGYTRSFGPAYHDAWLIKTDSLGVKVWDRIYGGTRGDWVYSVQQTHDGGYIMAGGTQSYGVDFSSDVWLIRADSLGDPLWTRTYGGASWEDGRSVQQTHDLGYVVAGFTYSYGAGSRDVWLIRTDSLGDKLWDRTYGDTLANEGYAVQETQDSGFVIVGHTEVSVGNPDVWLIKTTPSGDMVWDRTYGDTPYDRGYAVCQTMDTGYVVTGTTLSCSTGSCEPWLIKTDSLGDKLWDNTFDDVAHSESKCVQQTFDGGYVMCGITGGDAWVIKTDSLGVKVWDKTYGGAENDAAYSVAQTADGGYIVVGYTESYGAGYGDVWLIKIAPETGTEEAPCPNSRSTGMKLLPNPCFGSTSIRYVVQTSGKVLLQVHDAAGRTAKTLVNEEKEAGRHTVNFSARGLPGGIYFAELVIGEDHRETRKLILLRH
jgi:hypothetical protein